MQKTPVGKISHFFDKINVAVIEVSVPIKVGDKISIEGHGQAFEQVISSMQIEHKSITVTKKGDSVGMKTDKPCKAGDLVFKVIG